MTARRPILLALAAALSLGAALAAEPPAGAPKQPQREVCRNAARSLGSHIRTTRRCRTEEQWKEEEASKSGLPIGAQVTAGQNDGQPGRQPQ